ncbi:chromosome segregation protein SMC [Anaerococcus sp.]|uniref:chromosome segregation protein SMC n=1 Tax=uncultured Anaerococcus sp. TaxID=293428 RepID=UPI00258255BA|nr:chromosome segregation protein SMC [Anaerococcus sp.]MDU3211881.1 chromosome segregation protein SMC [Anaerococcus sp.]
MPFDEQITAIVGPNGSGKSNISDAIRWVLGEQSVKSLRGSKMNDVIFQGAENKNSLNLAEVNLNFSNEDKSLDIAYDKVVISRRIYRDGENEYRINGKKVRLKDVRELFLDTGIGKEGYSIIGQGRIDEIINSSNIERRTIFEEASGISKHKYRRDEASKKLNKVTEDLEIIEREWEYKSHDLEKLSVEAKNFQKWRKLSEQLNKDSYNYLTNKSKVLIKERENLEDNIEGIDESIKLNENNLIDIKDRLEPFNKDYKALKSLIENSEQSLIKYEKTIEANKNKIDLNKQKLAYNQKDYKRIEDNLKASKEKLEKFTEKLKEEENNLSSKNEEIDSTKTLINDLTLSIDEFKEKNSKFNKNLSILTDKYNNISNAINDYNINLKTNELLKQKRDEEKKVNQKKIELISFQMDELSIEIDDLTSKISKLKKILEQSELELEKINKEITNIENELSINEKNRSKTNINLKSAINEYKFNKNLIEKNEGYNYSVQDFLNKSKDSKLRDFYLDTLANLINVKDGYEDIIDNLIGGAVQNIVTKSKDETRNLINFVNQNNIGRITFLPIDSIKAYKKDKPKESEVIAMAYELLSYSEELENIIYHFLGSTVVVKDIDDAISLSKKIKGYRIISLDLDVINAWGSMVAGSNKNKRSNINILNRNKKLNDNKRKIGTLKSEHDRLLDEHSKLEKQKKDVLKESQKLENSYKKNKESFSKISNDIGNLTYKLENLSTQREELEDNNNISPVINSNIDIDELNNNYKKYKDLIDAINEDIKANEKLKIETTSKLSESKNKLEISNRDLNMINNTISSIKAELANLSQSQKIEDKLLLETDENLSQVSTENEKLLNKNLDLSKRIVDLSNELKSNKSLLEEKESENSKLIESLKDLEENINTFNIEKVKLSYKLESIDKEYNNLLDEVKPYISIEINDLKKKYKDENPVEVKKDKLISLQKSINNIGYFTTDSEKLYKESLEEFNFIDTQVKDLKESKDNIKKMIISLESEMKDEFKKNFDLINERFARIFKTLFIGGEAKLKLDDENVLLAGVDIIARPPSKSLKSITLLSGGEKALTAVALLFAIFETNPAPFAILDEIDAALDETNIKRYIEYLKSLSEKSQFIMITHRQTTMQLAEKIHGVTIGDDGISKVYSIDFSED